MKRAALRWTLSLAIPAALASGGCTGIPSGISQAQFPPTSGAIHRPADMSPERMRAIAELFESQGRWAKAKKLYARAGAAPAAIPVPIQPKAQELLARSTRQKTASPPQSQSPIPNESAIQLTSAVSSTQDASPPTVRAEPQAVTPRQNAPQLPESNPALAYHPTRWQRLKAPGAPLPKPPTTPQLDAVPTGLPDPSLQLAARSKPVAADANTAVSSGVTPADAVRSIAALPSPMPIAGQSLRQPNAAPMALMPDQSPATPHSPAVQVAQITTVPEFLPQAASAQHVHYIPGQAVRPLLVEPAQDASMIAQANFERPADPSPAEPESPFTKEKRDASVDRPVASGIEEASKLGHVAPRNNSADVASRDSQSEIAPRASSAVAEAETIPDGRKPEKFVTATETAPAMASEADVENVLYFEDVSPHEMDAAPEIIPARIAHSQEIDPSQSTVGIESSERSPALKEGELPVIEPARLAVNRNQGVVTAAYSRSASPADIWQSLESPSKTSHRSPSRVDETEWQIPMESQEFVTATSYAVQPIPGGDVNRTPFAGRADRPADPAVLPVPPVPNDSPTTPGQSMDSTDENFPPTAPVETIEPVADERHAPTPPEPDAALQVAVAEEKAAVDVPLGIQPANQPEPMRYAPASASSDEAASRSSMVESANRPVEVEDRGGHETVPTEPEPVVNGPATISPEASDEFLTADAGAARELIQKLDDERSRVRKAAAVQLTQAETNAAVPILVNWLETGTPKMRTFAAYLLGCFGSEAEAALPILHSFLNDEDPIFRLHVAEAIVRIEPTDATATAALIETLENGEDDVRWLAAFALGAVAKTHTEQAVDVLAEKLDDEDHRVRSAAALTLGAFRLAAKEAVPQLVQALVGTDERVSRAAAIALACIETDATLEDQKPSEWSIPVVVCEPSTTFQDTGARN